MTANGKTIAFVHAENATLRAEVALLHEQIRELKLTLTGVSSECTRLQERNATLEQTLQDYEQRLAQADAARQQLYDLFMQIPLPLALWSGPNHVYELANPSYQDIVGESDLYHKPLRDIFPEADEQGFIAILDRVYRTGEPFIAKEMPVTMDRQSSGAPETTWANFIYQPIRNATGDVYAIFFNTVDVTQQVLARRELEIKSLQLQHMNGVLHHQQSLLQDVLDNTAALIQVRDRHGRFLLVNQLFLNNFHGQRDDIIGKTLEELFEPAIAQSERESDQQILRTGQKTAVEQTLVLDGQPLVFFTTKFPLYDEQGARYAIGVISADITERKRAEAERIGLQEQVIAAQRAIIRELSTPIIPLAAGILAIPLIGLIDTERVQQVTESLLDGIAAHRATTALFDLTGAHLRDDQVANAIIGVAQAVRLLGAQVVLTGIHPDVAHALVISGADLSSIVTCSTLQAGLTYALRRR